jgi:glycosyltransferase involved in cell wall biosynthesis
MRIAFVDVTNWDYTAAAAHERPLGGSQSALCYLAAELARRGHDVRLYNRTKSAGVARCVVHAPLDRVSPKAWSELDVAVVQNHAAAGWQVRGLLAANAALVLWTQHADDQPAMQALSDKALQSAYDGFAFVSQWQQWCYEQKFGIDAGRAAVMRNGIGPAFENLFQADESIVSAKSVPPVLAYTSTPFRGLDLLLQAFPAIRAAVPEVQLRVYSSMQVYQMAAEQDQSRYGHLYQQCQNMPGVTWVGSLPQPQLARELRAASVLAYPNTFAETSCIAVMEALAAGCQVVTSRLGALEETCQGFATLVDAGLPRDEYLRQFVAGVVTALGRTAHQPRMTDASLRLQLATTNGQGTYRHRASQWLHWLERVSATRQLCPAQLRVG